MICLPRRLQSRHMESRKIYVNILCNFLPAILLFIGPYAINNSLLF